MSQEYTPVEWIDETPTTEGTTINKERLDQMQSAHHYADGFEEVDTIPTGNPGVSYHKIVYCTADSTIYRWDGTQWTKDVDDSTKALLDAHIANHSNPHQVTKAQVGLGNADNTSDADKPISTAMAAALAGKIDDAQLVTSWQAVPDNVHIPAEKLVKDDLATLSAGIDGINAKIPAAASASNQLADKNFVNSSISTNTANFLGTYDAVTGLGFTQAEVDAFTDPPDASTQAAVGVRIITAVPSAATATNNDYVFISVNKSTTLDNDWFWRFKFDGAGWVYEFTLNNSSFTADQWAAINSGITTGKVTGYDAHIASTANPHGVTKAQVGLGSVDNTSDANKPISTATQAALDAISSAAVKSVNGLTPSAQGEVTVLRKTTATLAAASWTNNAQTVTVTGLGATEDVLVSPAPASWSAWGAAGIRATAQAAGSITFECDTAPSADLTAQLIIGTIV